MKFIFEFTLGLQSNLNLGTPLQNLCSHCKIDLVSFCKHNFELKDCLFNLVPAPQHLSLEKQLNKSVLIGWSAPDPPGNQIVESYHVYVDGVLKVTVKANERTRALVEGVDLNRVRILLSSKN